MIIANLAKNPIFCTGGIGGVYRGAETTMDISADLDELLDSCCCHLRRCKVYFRHWQDFRIFRDKRCFNFRIQNRRFPHFSPEKVGLR